MVDVNAVGAVAVASALLQQIHPVPVRLRDERRFPGRCWRGVCVCPSLFLISVGLGKGGTSTNWLLLVVGVSRGERVCQIGLIADCRWGDKFVLKSQMRWLDWWRRNRAQNRMKSGKRIFILLLPLESCLSSSVRYNFQPHFLSSTDGKKVKTSSTK